MKNTRWQSYEKKKPGKFINVPTQHIDFCNTWLTLGNEIFENLIVYWE